MARILAVEPFYGGSHRAFLDGLIERSRHQFALLTLPPVFWKWRMRGAAISLADQARALEFSPDLILATDMISLAEFKALARLEAPAILYMHENQLSYPAHQNDPRDVHFGFTNLSSLLAADMVLWNSKYHLDSFTAALPQFINMMPDHQPRGLIKRILEKSSVLHPGVDLQAIDRLPRERDDGAPIILWNHRWEFDKQPELFFDAIQKLEEEGLEFRLAILGENYQVKPRVFIEAGKRFKPRIARMGFVEDREEYLVWLRRSWISVSTAAQENFGIAAVEAAYAGAFPLWPDRLSYPELIPPDQGREHLYSDFSDLVLKLKQAVLAAPASPELQARQKSVLQRFDWSNLIEEYDHLFETAVRPSPPVESLDSTELVAG